MKKWSTIVLLSASSLFLSAAVQAAPASLSITMKNYGGDGAYFSVYVVDAKGAYVQTLWAGGKKAKYYKHLSDWNRLSSGDAKRIDGVSGASLLQGRTLTINTTLNDAYFDKGYEVRVDAAAEDMTDSPADVRIPLTRANDGKAAAGRRYVQSFVYRLK